MHRRRFQPGLPGRGQGNAAGAAVRLGAHRYQPVAFQRPEQGLVKMKTTTLNQNGEPVQIMVANLVVARNAK